MVPSKPPPRLIDETEQLPFFPDLTVDDYIAQIIDVDDVVGEDIPAVTVSIEDKSVPIVLSAAENCAASMLRLISRMEAREMGTFWYSCACPLYGFPCLDSLKLTFCRVSNRIRDREQFHAVTPRSGAYKGACPAREETGVYVAASPAESRARLGHDGPRVNTIEWCIRAGTGKYLLSSFAYKGSIRLVDVNKSND